MGFVGLLAIFWFALGIYTATEEESDVECDFDGDGAYEETEECT